MLNFQQAPEKGAWRHSMLNFQQELKRKYNRLPDNLEPEWFAG
jgi:hypothetical protein